MLVGCDAGARGLLECIIRTTNQSENQIFRETSMALIVILTYADLNDDPFRLWQLVHERL